MQSALSAHIVPYALEYPGWSLLSNNFAVLQFPVLRLLYLYDPVGLLRCPLVMGPLLQLWNLEFYPIRPAHLPGRTKQPDPLRRLTPRRLY
jgi:hypothetical protein